MYYVNLKLHIPLKKSKFKNISFLKIIFSYIILIRYIFLWRGYKKKKICFNSIIFVFRLFINNNKNVSRYSSFGHKNQYEKLLYFLNAI